MEATENTHAQDHGHHHHKESFISKYVFSMDHKMISKQFLITAIVMGVVAVMLSIFFRLQLGWPGEKFQILNAFLVDKWAPDGILDRNAYLAMVTIHGTITGGLSGTFANLLIPLQIGARDMASGFLNMLSYWFFAVSSVIMLASLFVEGGAASGGDRATRGTGGRRGGEVGARRAGGLQATAVGNGIGGAQSRRGGVASGGSAG